MFEAWQIGIRLSMINQVSPVLASLSRQFAGAHRDAEKLNTLLSQMGRLTMVGSAVGGAGLFGLGMLSKALKPAEEYVHQLNLMNTAGVRGAELANATAAAWKVAGDNMTTTATGNLKAYLDLKNALGKPDEALMFLPIMQRMQTVLAASKEGGISSHSSDLAFSAIKALDIRGAVNDPENLKTQADMMTRVIEATQGRVTPQQFQSVFQYARQSKFALSDDFAYKVLPALMLEASTQHGGGGGSRGVGPGLAALYRFTNQGYINKKSMPLLAELGMVNPASQLMTTTSGTTVGPMHNAALAASNPFEWATTVVKPAVERYLASHHLAASTQNVLQVVGEMFRGNQLAASLMGEFIVKEQNFRRDQRLIEGTAHPGDAFEAAMSNDPNTAHIALNAAWENFQTSLMVNVVPVIVPALLDLSKALGAVGQFARENPNLTKWIVLGFGALAASMAIGGPLMVGIAATRIAFAGLPGIIGGIAPSLGALAVALKGLGVIAAGIAAYEAGGWLNEKLRGTWVGNWMDRNIGEAPPDVVMAAQTGGATGSWDTVRPSGSKTVQVTTNLYMDGRKVAEAVTEHQANSLSRPLAGSAFDPTMSLRPVAAPADW